MLVYGSCLLPVAWAECRLEPISEAGPHVMVRRLVGTCTTGERRNLAIKGEEVLQALMEGRGIELDGVVLTGDVMLDRLPVEAVTPEDFGIPIVGERLSSSHIEEVRRIRGPLILRHVEVQDVIATNFVMHGFLLVEGPVGIVDTTIQRSIDFSRTAFLDEVEFSGSHIFHEGFFIQTVFTKSANFENMNFGMHSRFHKVVFGGKATFTDSTFRGLAELLEVTYRQEADFANAHFIMGTGFSGSSFEQQATFTRAAFDREAYFRFVIFEGDAKFQGARFGAAADFTEARFQAGWDFANVNFAVLPQFPKDQSNILTGAGNRFKDAKVQAGIFVLLFIFFLVFILRSRRSRHVKTSKSP